MILGIAGATSEIAKKYRERYADGFDVICERDIAKLPLNCDQYLICSGVLFGGNIAAMDYENVEETFRVNYINIARFCDTVFNANGNARICIIGSASGIKGSFDMAYAGAKSAMHLYVKTKRLKTAGQHLVCVAPWYVHDAGMTKRRKDLGQILVQGEKRRLKRWMSSKEIAKIAYFALGTDAVCNTVIEAQGGNW